MQGRDLARVRADLAARRLPDRAAAAERAHSGRARVEAARFKVLFPLSLLVGLGVLGVMVWAVITLVTHFAR